MVAVLFISLIIFMVLGVPIAVSIGFATLASMISAGSGNLFMVAQKMVTAMDATTLLAIPLFILAGAIMGKGGISKRIIDLSYELFGWIPGSLGIVCVVSCMFFAALSGSSPATVAAIGGIMVPAMIDDGYPAGFSCSVAAAGGHQQCQDRTHKRIQKIPQVNTLGGGTPAVLFGLDGDQYAKSNTHQNTGQDTSGEQVTHGFTGNQAVVYERD